MLCPECGYKFEDRHVGVPAVLGFDKRLVHVETTTKRLQEEIQRLIAGRCSTLKPQGTCKASSSAGQHSEEQLALEKMDSQLQEVLQQVKDFKDDLKAQQAAAGDADGKDISAHLETAPDDMPSTGPTVSWLAAKILALTSHGQQASSASSSSNSGQQQQHHHQGTGHHHSGRLQTSSSVRSTSSSSGNGGGSDDSNRRLSNDAADAADAYSRLPEALRALRAANAEAAEAEVPRTPVAAAPAAAAAAAAASSTDGTADGSGPGAASAAAGGAAPAAAAISGSCAAAAAGSKEPTAGNTSTSTSSSFASVDGDAAATDARAAIAPAGAGAAAASSAAAVTEDVIGADEDITLDAIASGSSDTATAAEAAKTAAAGVAAAANKSEDDTCNADTSMQVDVDQQRRIQKLQDLLLILKNRKQQEQLLLATLAEPMGFVDGKPMAALVVLRACLHWGVFEESGLGFLDKIIQELGCQIEVEPENNTWLAYWLTISVALLHLMERNLKPTNNSSGNGGSSDGERADPAVVRWRLGAFVAKVLSALRKKQKAEVAAAAAAVAAADGYALSSTASSIGASCCIGGSASEALAALVGVIFHLMSDNVKKAIKPVLAFCQLNIPGYGPPADPFTATRINPKGSTSCNSAGRAAVAAAAASAHSTAWGVVLAVFDDLLQLLKENWVPRPLSHALFEQLFGLVDVQLFNQLLVNRDCCSYSMGESMAAGLAQAEAWIQRHSSEWVGESWDQLCHIRQAVTFLLTPDKPSLTLEQLAGDVCPSLSMAQLYALAGMYWDDKQQTGTVSNEVLGRIYEAMNDNEGAAGGSTGCAAAAAAALPLLHEDNSLPFHVLVLLTEMDDRDLHEQYLALAVQEPVKPAKYLSMGISEIEVEPEELADVPLT